MKGSCKGRFQKSRSMTIGKRKVFNTRFDVLSQGDESSKTPSSSPRFSGPGCSPNFCDSPSIVNTGKKVEDDDAQALRQLELCLRVHAKIASGVYPCPPTGTLSGPVRSVTSGSMVRPDGRSRWRSWGCEYPRLPVLGPHVRSACLIPWVRDCPQHFRYQHVRSARCLIPRALIVSVRETERSTCRRV